MLSPIEITNELVSPLCPVRPEQGHKGSFGRLLIYAGSRGMGGAAIMATGSALRSGVGLVYVLTPESIQAPLMTRCPEALGLSVPDDEIQEPKSKLVPAAMRVNIPKPDWFSPMLEAKDAVLMGPGLATDRADVKKNLSIALDHAAHLVLDAGALTVLAETPEQQSSLSSRKALGLAPVVLTPHVGEFQRLCPDWVPGDMEGAGAFAKENGVVLVLKSNETNIFTPDGKWYSNRVSNSGLAKGGSGDVLAGLLSGLLASGMTEENAAVAAVKIHSLAGQLARAEHGERAMLPTDLWDNYHSCFLKLNWEKGSDI